MDYPDRVFLWLKSLPSGARVKVSGMKEPNRFACAVNYLVELGVISNYEYGVNEDWTILKKY